MELDIEVKWTQEDIERMLREKLEREGLLLLPQPKRKKKGEEEAEDEAENKYFVWPRGGNIKVRARAMISQRAKKAAEAADDEQPSVDDETPHDTTPLDPAMLPDGANIEALQAVERAAEDPLAAAKRRPLMKGESRTPPKPKKKGER
jgi:hypothetical protein